MTVPTTEVEATNPRKTARQARSAATVEAIVEAAARILETAGLPGYTTNGVAERAGVSIGSLYQYFPNKDAITRALIRRELATLDAAIAEIEPGCDDALARFIAVAVAHQLRRPKLAQMLEIEEGHLATTSDIEPVRMRVMTTLSRILATAGLPSELPMVADMMALTATILNAASVRGEDDALKLSRRVDALIRARANT